MNIKINHPMADRVSRIKESQMGMRAYAGSTSSELAFFSKGEWVVEPIPEFAQYHDGDFGDTAVYGWVPDTEVDAFLDKYRA